MPLRDAPEILTDFPTRNLAKSLGPATLELSEFDQSFFPFFHKEKRDTASGFARNPVELPHKKSGKTSGIRVQPELFFLFS